MRSYTNLILDSGQIKQLSLVLTLCVIFSLFFFKDNSVIEKRKINNIIRVYEYRIDEKKYINTFGMLNLTHL